MSQNAIISDDILKNKAQYFGTQLGINEFGYSSGWLCNFKKRYGISKHRIVGEAQGSDMKAVLAGRAELGKLLSEYEPENVLNYDETGLFYRVPPSATLVSKPVHGCKKQKDRITVGLCANATGKYKSKPVVIAKSARPRCFGQTFDPNI